MREKKIINMIQKKKIQNDNLNLNFKREKNENNELQNVETLKDIHLQNIKSQRYAENTMMRLNKRKSKDDIKKKKIYSTKVCTLCGYIYFRKEIGNNKACICYYYTSKCNWFKEKLCKFDVISSILIEFYCQFCIIGYNSILSEKLLDTYSYSKNIKFYIALFIISIIFGIIAAFNGTISLKEKEKESKESDEVKETEESKEQKNGKDDCWNTNYCGLFSYLLSLIICYSFLTFISSFCYYFEEKPSRKRWDNILMAEYIYFKTIDMSILSFFDFFDNTDIFNTSLFITLEKFIWMIVEAIFELAKVNKKILIIIQIIISGIPTIFYIVFIIYGIIGCCLEKN